VLVAAPIPLPDAFEGIAPAFSGSEKELVGGGGQRQPRASGQRLRQYTNLYELDNITEWISPRQSYPIP
jgi:hypothetical protein